MFQPHKLKRNHFSITFSILASLFMFFSVYTTNAYSAKVIFEVNNESISSKAEQTIWRYRTHNGKREQRLWSITYGKWLTDWIPA